MTEMKNITYSLLRSNMARHSTVATVMILTAQLVLGGVSINAQSSAHKIPPAQAARVFDWQKAAGGKQKFEVASVKVSSPNMRPRGMEQLIPFDGGLPPDGSLFSANVPLFSYITFAYKIVDVSQYGPLRAQLPKWAQTTRFEIQARSKDRPTRDQLRLMLQSLLEDRFKLVFHKEVKQLPVYAFVLEKPGMVGPNLQPHPESESCVARPLSTPTSTGISAKRPLYCGLDEWETEDGQTHLRMLNMTMEQIAGLLSGMAGLTGNTDNRPFLDQTGLTGHFDLNLEFNPQLDSSPDAGGPTIIGAMKKQLGLKLLKQTGPVTVYVVDHLEMPSEN